MQGADLIKIRCLLLDGTYIIAAMLCLSWIILVLCTCFIKVKKVSSIARLPNESGRITSEKNRSKIVDSSYHHPYTRKHSTSFEESFQYSAPPPELGAFQKYAIPIAPHIEKVQLPASYDNTGENVLEHQPLTRHHFSTTPGGWVEYTTPPAASPYYYQDRGGHGENPWYPNIDKNRIT